MTLEKFIRPIIKDTGLSKKEVLELMNARKEELKGLISDKAALFMLGRELCVDMPNFKENSITKNTEKTDNLNVKIDSSWSSPDLSKNKSNLINNLSTELKNKHSDNLIALFGIGSYFNDSLPSNWIKNDLDLILIMKSIDNIPKEDWDNRFRIKKFNGQKYSTGYNTIEAYENSANFNKVSPGTNYEWSLICLKHPKNSKLLYGKDIRSQIPADITLSFDYGDILSRGFYHLERSLQEGKAFSGKIRYSKAIFKIAFYMCIFFDNSFRHTSLVKIGEKLRQLNQQGKVDIQILEFFEEAMIYRMTRLYKSNFSTLRKKTIYCMFSLLIKGKLHKKMNLKELVKYLSIYFGGFPYLIRKAKKTSLNKTLPEN
ncbi:hypothetical protein LCGC14_1639520 [marine sediment metagenome]|uniref:Uncharacterized protein n=1 Tax=marine sediment metagenome TaxID=412755 RepID=A0A0F9I002_9ZZZZ